MSSGKIPINCLFLDNAHPREIQQQTIVLDVAEFKTMKASRFLVIAQEQHRKEGCSYCPGAIIVKAAWLVNLPTATAIVEFQLEHDPPGGIEFVVPDRLISEYVPSSPEKGAIRLIFESTFDSKCSMAIASVRRALT